ncbi:MAG: hypothetical protein AAFV80_01220 [Bacteroidota bacterium]
MSSHFLWLSLAVFTFVGCQQPVLGQDLTGEWSAPELGTELHLKSDGTFLITSSNGQLDGTYQYTDYQIQVWDQFGGTYTYSITELSEERLFMTEQASGIALHYFRKPAQGNELLASAKGFQLQESDIRLGAALISFVTDQLIQPAEMDLLRTSAIREFKANPTLFREGMSGIQEVMDIVRQANDASTIAQYRQMLFSNLYIANKDLPEANQSEIVRVMLRYITVESFDSKSGKVLSSRDLDAAVAYINQLVELESGQSLPSAERQTMRNTIKSQFQNMNVEEQDFYASASVYWSLVNANLNQFDTQQQDELQEQFQPVVGNDNWTSTDDWTSKWEGKEMSPETYRFLSEMSLQNHVSMMNSIEAIGGTGNYWSLTPSYMPAW